MLELASFERFSPTHEAFLDQLTEIIGIVLNTIEANMRTEDLLDAVAVAGAGTAEPPAGAAADEPGARGKGRAARPPERGSRAQEPGSRTGPPGARGKGRAARADVEVQVRVPGQHVARAAHAAQQPADSVRSAVQEPGRQPDAEAGRVRQDDPLVGQRSADADQRHSRSVEDRIGHRRQSIRPTCRSTTCSATSSARSATSPRRRTSTSSSASIRDCRRAMFTDTEAPAAGAQEPAVERVQVHARRAASR